MSAEYVIRKLQAFGPLPAASEAALRVLAEGRQKFVAARRDVIREGDDPREVNLIIDGWACSYKMLDDGRRQIIAFFLPGDLCDMYVYILSKMDHSIASLTPLRFARISGQALEQLGDTHPRVLRALLWESLVTSSIQREWAVNLGQRTAYEGLAHLLCELFLRLRNVGLVEADQCHFPLTRAILADALGLTETHLGRMLKRLSDAKLITFRRRTLTVHDLKTLKAVAGFNANYLHQNG